MAKETASIYNEEVAFENEDIRILCIKRMPDRDGDIYWVYAVANRKTKHVTSEVVYKGNVGGRPLLEQDA